MMFFFQSLEMIWRLSLSDIWQHVFLVMHPEIISNMENQQEATDERKKSNVFTNKK